MGLGTPFLTVFFSLFVMRHLIFGGRRNLAALIFIALVIAIFTCFVLFLRHANEVLPKVIATSIPTLAKYAEDWGIQLPFEDVNGLKEFLMGSVHEELAQVANFAKLATKEFLFLIVGLVVACSIFLGRSLEKDPTSSGDLYSTVCCKVNARFRTLYGSFETVIGAQIIISAINSVLTAVFVFLAGVPHPLLIITITFLCGLLPIVGNLISNSVIVGVASTSSPQLAIASLTYLVVVHKFEYFLNSKIIGSRIKNPMWLTLLGLLVGEKIMGIPGMIMAPVVLHYFKVEASGIPVQSPTDL